DVGYVDQGGGKARLRGGVFEIGQRAVILGAFCHPREMEMPSAAELLPGLDQALMDRVILIGRLRNDAPLDRLLEPGPLKYRRLEDRGRRVGIVFEQLCRSLSVEAEVEPAIEAAFVALPAFRDQRPERFGDLQPLEIFFIVDGAADELEAHRVDLARR